MAGPLTRASAVAARPISCTAIASAAIARTAIASAAIARSATIARATLTIIATILGKRWFAILDVENLDLTWR